MVNRRLLRIKVLQVLYGYYGSAMGSLPQAERTLLSGLDAYFDLLHFLWRVPCDLSARDARQRADREARAQRFRRVPLGDASGVRRHLSDSLLVGALGANADLMRARPGGGIAFQDRGDFLDQLLSDLRGEEFYVSYVSAGSLDWGQDVSFWLSFYDWLGDSKRFRDGLFELRASLEVDIDTALVTVLTQLTRLGAEEVSSRALVPSGIEARDREFGLRLLGYSIMQRDRLREMIARFAHRWEMDRITMIDQLILQQGTAEALNFAEIPRRVTINEYIELAHLFSTPSSPSFVNGILDNLTQTLMSEGVIVKRGQGLREG